MKHWLTYFNEIRNVHLTKEVGLIPYYVGTTPGWRSTLAGHFNDTDYPALNQEVIGLQTLHVEREGKAAFLEKAFLRHLKRAAKNIDVLHLMHLSRESLIYGLYYKQLNPRGRLYLKLDAYNSHLAQRKQHSKNAAKNVIFQAIEKQFMRALDLVSIENKAGYDLALKSYPEWAGKLLYLPNGANDRYIDRHFDAVPQKDQKLLCVSRPGSADKNCELIISALPYFDFPEGWTMEVVGPCTDDFLHKWNAARQAFPLQAARVHFCGEVKDRHALYHRYAESAVVFLPSRFESFGIVYAEALHFGAVLVGHKGMYAYQDLSANGKYGTYFNDNEPMSFATALHEAVCLSQQQQIVPAARTHAKTHFAWSKIVKSLLDKLEHGSTA